MSWGDMHKKKWMLQQQAQITKQWTFSWFVNGKWQSNRKYGMSVQVTYQMQMWHLGSLHFRSTNRPSSLHPIQTHINVDNCQSADYVPYIFSYKTLTCALCHVIHLMGFFNPIVRTKDAWGTCRQNQQSLVNIPWARCKTLVPVMVKNPLLNVCDFCGDSWDE